ncbi:MAG: tetratricopeptide repeat protein [Spirosomaceae bacterium]|nr:tetratricopeptide repeat protein [Spirosomataceae bacterium]
MAKKSTSTNDNSGIEIIESAEALKQEINKAEGFLKKNQKLLVIIAAAIIGVVVGYFGYNYWMDTQNQEAQVAMVDATFAYEADSLSQALNGVGGGDGMLTVADDFGSTKAGNLAHFYAGTALMKQGKFDEAIEHLEDFSSKDLVLQGKAYALIGDAYMEKGNASEAAGFYKKAAGYQSNKFLTPGYLMKLALAQETAKDNAAAIKTYDALIQDYPAATETINAKKYKAMLEAMSAK